MELRKEVEGNTPSYPTTLRSRKFSRVGGHDPYPSLTYLEAKTRRGKTSHHRGRQQEHYQKVHGGCTVRVRGQRTGRRNRTGPKGSAAAARELNTTGWFNAWEGQEGRKPLHIPGEHRPHLARSQSCKLAVAQLGPLWRWWSGPSHQHLCRFRDDFVCHLLCQRQNLLYPITKA